MNTIDKNNIRSLKISLKLVAEVYEDEVNDDVSDNKMLQSLHASILEMQVAIDIIQKRHK